MIIYKAVGEELLSPQQTEEFNKNREKSHNR